MTTELITNRQPTAEELKAMGTTVTIKTGDKSVTVTPEKLEQVARSMEEKLLQDRIALSNAQAQEETKADYKPLDPTATQAPAKPTETKEKPEKNEYLGPRRVSGEALLSALKYVFKALPKPKDQPDVSYLIIHHDTEKKRIVLSARDGCRWHETYIEAPEQLLLVTSALQWHSVNTAKKWLDNALKACAHTTVEIDSALNWFVHYDGPSPLELVFDRLEKTPNDWQLPTFTAPKPGEVNRGAVHGYQSKHVSDATTWTGGACVRRDDPDASGRRHLVLVDPSGDQLARAVVCPLGMTDGLPDSKQTEIDGTLSPPGVAKSKRQAQKSKTVTIETSDGKKTPRLKSKPQRKPKTTKKSRKK